MSYEIFLSDPYKSLTFLALILGFTSFWVYRSIWLWGGFFAISYALAFLNGIADPITLIPIGSLFLFHWILSRDPSCCVRFFLFVLATAISIGLWFHMLPGFHNWEVAPLAKISPLSTPTSIYFKFDKPFVGFFVLAFALPLLRGAQEWRKLITYALPATIIGILLLLGPMLYFKAIAWDPKIPNEFFPWIINNLFFVAIPEEAFARGFLQEQLFRALRGAPFAGTLAVIGASLIFTLLHIFWAPNFLILTGVFLASLIYGTIYQTSRAIEASILCHFLLNLTHYLLFTYPALAH